MTVRRYVNRDDPDPDSVGDVISRFHDELPHAPGASAAPETVALREAFYAVKEADGPVTSDAVVAAVWEDASTLTSLYPRRSAWWRAAGRPFLPLLPGIVQDGTTWRFDPASDEDRPAVPADPTTPSETDVDATIDAVDVPEAESQTANRRNRLAAKRAGGYLVKHGEASAEDLKEQFKPSKYNRETGHFDNPHDWFREVGRPILRALPGIDPPRVAGQPWRFVGVDADTDT